MRAVLVVFLAALLSGCFCVSDQLIPKPVDPVPAKPYLPSWSVLEDGGVSINRNDTERLMKYILELERHVKTEK